MRGADRKKNPMETLFDLTCKPCEADKRIMRGYKGKTMTLIGINFAACGLQPESVKPLTERGMTNTLDVSFITKSN